MAENILAIRTDDQTEEEPRFIAIVIKTTTQQKMLIAAFYLPTKQEHTESRKATIKRLNNLIEEMLTENFRVDEAKNIIMAGDVNMCQNKTKENNDSAQRELQKIIINHNLVDMAKEVEGEKARPTFYPKILTHRPSRLDLIFLNIEMLEDNTKVGIAPLILIENRRRH